MRYFKKNAKKQKENVKNRRSQMMRKRRWMFPAV
jgi:hypothetical protein